MKGLILRACLLVFLVFATLESVTFLTSRMASLYHKTAAYSGTFADYSWMAKLQHPCKILIMGSSTARYGLSPQIIAKEMGYLSGEVVNSAHDARSPMQSYFIWKSLKPEARNSIRLVLYGFDPWIFYQTYYEWDDFAIAQLNPIQRLDIAFNPAFSGTFQSKVRRYSFLWSALGNSVRNALTDTSKRYGEHEIPDDLGSKALNQHPKNFSGGACAMFPSPAKRRLFPISSLYFSYLKKLKIEVEAQGARFIVLKMPKSRQWQEDYVKNCPDIEPEIETWIKAELGSNVELDASAFVANTKNSDVMADDVHLNAEGQKIFSTRLAKTLKNDFPSPLYQSSRARK